MVETIQENLSMLKGGEEKEEEKVIGMGKYMGIYGYAWVWVCVGIYGYI